MGPTLRWCVGAVLLAATWALAQPFSGSWTGPSGQVRLTQEGQFVTGALTIEGRGGRVHGSVDKEELVGLWLAGGAKATFWAALNGTLLTVTVEGQEPLTFKAVSVPKPRASVVATAPAVKDTPAAPASPPVAEAKPVQALKGGLCAQSEGAGPTWTRRLVFDGRGHLSVGADVAPVRRGETPTTRQYWVEDVGAYKVKGSEVSMRFGRDEQRCVAGAKDASGRVTEMLCSGHLYEAATCQASSTSR